MHVQKEYMGAGICSKIQCVAGCLHYSAVQQKLDLTSRFSQECCSPLLAYLCPLDPLGLGNRGKAAVARRRADGGSQAPDYRHGTTFTR